MAVDVEDARARWEEIQRRRQQAAPAPETARAVLPMADRQRGGLSPEQAAESSRRAVKRLALMVVSTCAQALQKDDFTPARVRGVGLDAQQTQIDMVLHSIDLHLEDVEKIENSAADLSETLPGNGRRVGPLGHVSHAEANGLHEKHREKREAAIRAALEACAEKAGMKL